MAKTKTILDLNQETLDNIKSSGFFPVSEEGRTVKVPLKDITDAIDNKAVNFDDTVGGTGAPSDPYSVKEMEGPYNKPTGGKVNIMGKTYDYVVINNQYWLAQNFEGDFCRTANEEGLNFINNPEGIKGEYYKVDDLDKSLLPDGWRIPTRNDWESLRNYVVAVLRKSDTYLNAKNFGGGDDRSGLELSGYGSVEYQYTDPKALKYSNVKEFGMYAVQNERTCFYNSLHYGDYRVGIPATFDFLNVRLVKDVSEEDSHDGKKGLVPAPKQGDENKVLTGNGLYRDPNKLVDVPKKLSQLENDKGFIGDEPIDPDGIYARRNGQWVKISQGGEGGGIEEAPNDGFQYARKNLGWAKIESVFNLNTDNFFVMNGTRYSSLSNALITLPEQFSKKNAILGIGKNSKVHTGLYLDDNFEITIQFSYVWKKSYESIFSNEYVSESSNIIRIISPSTNGGQMLASANTKASSSFTFGYSEDNVVCIGKRNGKAYCYKNFSPSTSSYTYGTENISELSLFGSDNEVTIRVFCVKVEDVVVANYIPAVRNSDGVAGFFDTISKTFKTSDLGDYLSAL